MATADCLPADASLRSAVAFDASDDEDKGVFKADPEADATDIADASLDASFAS